MSISPKTTQPETKKTEEEQLTQAIEAELTDEQLVQLAEGSSSWGAHCNEGPGCGGGY